ncbi:alpha/beta hydrolase [Mycobacterium sp.]|uniref:alpha/beta hydrolase n=1 Tax=Mycobacterium sp. TaxID=1785 RepID=UPI0031D5DFCA
MAVSISAVRASQPNTLLDAADDAAHKHDELQTIIADEREMLSSLQDHWTGSAATAAIGQVLRQIGVQERVEIRLQQLQSALRNAGDQLRGLRSTILEYVSALSRLGFSVADDGTVTPHQWLIGDLLEGIANKASAVLKKLLQLFDDVDRQTAAAIAEAAGPSIPNTPVEVNGQEIEIPSPDTAPEDVQSWWNSRSDEQRKQLIAQHPSLLGNLGGIPADVRDQVNVKVMDDDLDRVENTVRQHGVSAADVVKDPGRYGLSADDITRYQNAQKTQDGLLHDLGVDTSQDHRRYRDISPEERLQRNLRPTMLWAYDPTAFNGRGKAAIAIGNPDTSPNTAVIVPGTGSSVKDGWLSDGHNDARNLYDQSQRADPSHPTAVIAWMGYDTPESFTDPNIANPGLARAGGDLLAWDVNSLGVTHAAGVPQHVTVIGHSYGSTTVADAFANSGMHANDAILLGCPGTDVAKSAADFHLPPGHVFVGDASTDPVGWLGEAGPGLPNVFNHSLGDLIGSSAGLGSDPAHEGFGAVRFRAEVPDAESVKPTDHSHYYHRGSESLFSMGNIVSGHASELAGDGMLAGARTDQTVLKPPVVNIPGIGDVTLPIGDTTVPVIHDPEWDRPGSSVHDDHGF